jgi:hypothetical protein
MRGKTSGSEIGMQIENGGGRIEKSNVAGGSEKDGWTVLGFGLAWFWLLTSSK